MAIRAARQRARTSPSRPGTAGFRATRGIFVRGVAGGERVRPGGTPPTTQPQVSDPAKALPHGAAAPAPTDQSSPQTVPPASRAERTAEPSPAVQPDEPARGCGPAVAEGKVTERIEVFRKVVAVDPTAKNHGDLGALLYRLTAFDEAAIHLRAAAELEPGNADRWIALANVYYRKVDPGEAWKAEKRARQAEPGLELGRDGEGMRVRKGGTAPQNP